MSWSLLTGATQERCLVKEFLVFASGARTVHCLFVRFVYFGRYAYLSTRGDEYIDDLGASAYMVVSVQYVRSADAAPASEVPYFGRFCHPTMRFIFSFVISRVGLRTGF